MENRNFARVKFPECASVRHNNQMFFANILNASLQGMFITTDQNVPLNTPLKITVYLSPNSSIYLNAEVVHCEDTGIGVQIKDMDVKSFIHLRNAITLQCNDHELIMREALKIAHLIH
jgi:hypothetical protein